MRKSALTHIGLYISMFIIAVWYVYIQMTGVQEGLVNSGFALAYGIIPLLGGIGGLILAKSWKNTNKDLEQAVVFLAWGLVAWAIGETIWSFYTLVMNVEVPYPSLADVFFLLSNPLWAWGLIKLAKGVGVGVRFNDNRVKAALVIVPIVTALVSYFILFQFARGGQLDTNASVLTLIFDIAYPTLDTILLILVLVIDSLMLLESLEKKLFQKPLIYLTVGLVLTFLGDMSFSYTSGNGTFYNGHISDMLFAASLFFIALGTTSIDV